MSQYFPKNLILIKTHIMIDAIQNCYMIITQLNQILNEG